ncbi:MAG: hypothetical protein KME60_03410 [Cyanomargarita calcarea GSE-NOS-MK-12-04C]|jgi:phage anti-repressor protein|uniref:Uncharacterized protein n=1 Tax=Cyanomargarita calcarea GSE-NOS-MK-12-04C TaxID=2839659 RepID=A0A951QHP9_9CYAN|nr:hypothetical protein [Cyanomargarita calcarea GSE-NOS-MK-12-04C]
MTNIQPFSFKLAQSLYASQESFPVDFDFAVEWLGYSRKDNAKRALTKNFVNKTDFLIIEEMVERLQGGGAAVERIYLSANCLKEMGMLAQTEKGKQVRQYFLKCEEIAKKAIAVIDSASNVTDLDVVANLAAMMGGLAKGIKASTDDIKRTVASGEVVVVSEVRYAAHNHSEENKAIASKLDRLIESHQRLENSVESLSVDQVETIVLCKSSNRNTRTIAFHCETEEQYQEFLALAERSGMSRSKFFLEVNCKALGVE